jgi:mannitol-1-/sugar-/sorbitol-6-phosphatase
MKQFTSVEKIKQASSWLQGFPSFCFLLQHYARMRVAINEGNFVMQEISCQAIVFDLDGVLVDSTVIVERHWRMWAAQHGLDSEFILARAHGRRTIDTLRTVASHLNLDLEQEAALLEKREVEDTEGLITVPGAVELLLALPGHSWAIVTSGSRMLATTRLRAVGLPIPQTLVTAEEVYLGKPHPEGYLKASALLGLEPQNCLVIEDAPAGIQAAHAAGSRVIGVTTTFPVADLDEADFVVPSLASLHLAFTENGTTPTPLLTLSVF